MLDGRIDTAVRGAGNRKTLISPSGTDRQSGMSRERELSVLPPRSRSFSYLPCGCRCATACEMSGSWKEELQDHLLGRWFVDLDLDAPGVKVAIFTKNGNRILAGEVAIAVFV